MVRNIENYFIGTAVLLGAAGMVLGIVMGIQENFALAPVHTHVNLVGWVSLALFGICYRVDLAVKDGWSVLHFWVAAAGAVVLPLGILLAITGHQPALAIIGSLLTLASMLLFLANYLRRLARA
jgi:hypothetical protein